MKKLVEKEVEKKEKRLEVRFYCHIRMDEGIELKDVAIKIIPKTKGVEIVGCEDVKMLLTYPLNMIW